MKQTAIVTGGSRGIGFAIAKRLCEDGFQVVIFATKPAENCREQLLELEGLASKAFYVQGNIADGEDRKRLLAQTIAQYGAVHVLVNNAAVGPRERNDLLDMTEESFDWVMDINTKATMFLTQLVAKQMLLQEPVGKKRGTIIQISSCSAEVSSINRGEYCVSKAAMSMLTKLYADRLAPEGIYVHEVRPGVIATDMTSAVKVKYDKLIEAGALPIARWGTPEDVANAVSVLAGDQLLYTTGNYIDVDGGMHIKRL